MATKIDLNGMLDELQAALLAANTTTASPIDLSSAMSTRVKQVYKTHPNSIPPEVNVMPFVTCYVKGKTTQNITIAKDQLSAKRKAVVDVEVVGAVWNTSYTSAAVDPADNDVHELMENIELALRGSPTLAAKCLWQIVDGVQYYDSPLDEDAHLRFGIITLRATVYY